ncbi:MAG: hypothetical protein U1E18_08265 [Brevundimonas sp.]|uniref:hypothetical protein n=1 Tax=Brevundimonas sp. TaxID=1871086 RepID=UPI002AB907FD|nr:hypothetical protein [Brevundimonas sp.]MDZ4109576.1 hypothetical protein [Brevundimonas sp.]
MSAALVVALVGCADPDPHDPDILAGQRLEVGDQRLIGHAPAVIHGPSFGVVGVRCEPLGFPIQILEPDRDPARARRELAFVSRFNRAMVAQPYYTAARCEPFGSEDDWGLGLAVDEREGPAPLPAAESFDRIFGFPAP